MLNATAIFGAGLVLGFAGLFSSIRQAEVCANGIAGVGAGHNVFGATMVMAVYPELYAILALLVVILIGGTLRYNINKQTKEAVYNVNTLYAAFLFM